MRIIVLLILLLCQPAWAFMPMLGKGRSPASENPTVWRDNITDTSESEAVAVGLTRAHGQRVDIDSSFTLDHIDVILNTSSGSITWECRIGQGADLTSYDEHWTGIVPADGTMTLTSVVNPSYTTGDGYFIFACLETSGSGVTSLSYSGDNWTQTLSKRIYSVTTTWIFDTTNNSEDLRMIIWEK